MSKEASCWTSIYNNNIFQKSKQGTKYSLPANTPPIKRQAISILILHSSELELLLELLMRDWKIRSFYNEGIDMTASNDTADVTKHHYIVFPFQDQYISGDNRRLESPHCTGSLSSAHQEITCIFFYWPLTFVRRRDQERCLVEKVLG